MTIFEIFIPEEGRACDIKFNHEFKFENGIDLYPSPFDETEFHISDIGKIEFENHNQLFVDLFVEICNQMEYEDDVTSHILYYHGFPFGPVGIKTKNGDLISAIKIAIEQD